MTAVLSQAKASIGRAGQVTDRTNFAMYLASHLKLFGYIAFRAPDASTDKTPKQAAL